VEQKRERTADVLIVGARCAGSPLAMLLARQGKRVVVVDRADMPSDQPMSTHFIQPFGMAILDEIGIGDKVREFAPAIPGFMNGVEGTVAHIRFPAGRGGSCPRRTDLDSLLVDEARAAGANIWLKTNFIDVLRERDRVVGAVVEHDGKRTEIRAEIVVGADGRNSTVAEEVGAKEYLSYAAPRAAYWAYWPRPDWYTQDPRYQGAAAIIHDGDRYRFIFPANRDQLLVGVAFPVEELDQWKHRHREKLLELVHCHPLTAPITDSEPLSKVLGIINARFFFRQAAGPGWALVGDAGLFKDPAPGLGICDAFRDARALADAIMEGSDLALERYWRKRDVESIELFYFARDQGSPSFNNPLNRLVFSKIARDKALQDRIISVVNREISPAQMFGWLLGAMLKGQFGVVKPFLTAGKFIGFVQKELTYRRKLAESI